MRLCSMGLLLRRHEILLGLRATHKTIDANCWDLIGGGIKGDETPEAALIREVQEEIGVTPTAFAPMGVISDLVGVYHLFVVTGWNGGEPRLCNEEHTELRWFAIEEACALQALADPRYPELFRSLSAEYG